jgi:putative flippase GtrA
MKKPTTTRSQLLLSVVTSLLSFGLDFGVLALLTEVVRLHYLVSAALSFTLGTTMSYALSILFVFDLRRYASPALEYGVFVLVGVVGLGLNELLLWTLTDVLGIYYLVSKIAAASLVFFWNFGARKLILFSAPKSAPPAPG